MNQKRNLGKTESHMKSIPSVIIFQVFWPDVLSFSLQINQLPWDILNLQFVRTGHIGTQTFGDKTRNA